MRSMYVSCYHRNWDVVLTFVALAYNCTVRHITGYYHIRLNYSRDAMSPSDAASSYVYDGRIDDCEVPLLCYDKGAPHEARLRTLQSQQRKQIL